MRFPVDQPYQITQGFSQAHLGIDIAPPGAGYKVLSPENSTVYMVGNNPALEGQYIILRGDSSVYYYFGHFAQQLVSKGQRLAEGQQIGIMGMTGQATGIHTHHEVRPNQPGPGTQIDPIEYYNKGEDMAEPADYRVNDGDIENYFVNFLGRKPTEQDLQIYRGKTHKEITYAIMGSSEFKTYTAGAGSFVAVDFPVFKEKG